MRYYEFRDGLKKGIIPKLTENQIYDFFLDSCRNGDLEVASWLWEFSNYSIDIHKDDEKLFIYSLINHQIKMAKYLWKISKFSINVHADSEYPFRFSVYSNNIDLAKWLWEISKHSIKIHIKGDFRMISRKYNIEELLHTMSNSRIKLGKYYYKLIQINIHIIHHYLKPYDGPGYLNAINF